MSETKTTTLSALRNPVAAQRPVSMGFETKDSFDLMQRAARLLSNSTLVPEAYRAFIKDKKEKDWVENPQSLSNCVVALNMAVRMKADPLMVMQNLYVVEGRPSWSSQWIIASINNCGRFAPLRFAMQDGEEMDVEYTVSEWEKGNKYIKKKTAHIKNRECIAWTVEKNVRIPAFTPEQMRGKSLLDLCREYGVPVVESPSVSIEMAVKEGWYGKNGSKWQTMPDVMLRYRAASFFGKLYAPELLMGIPSAEEVQDIVTVDNDSGLVVTTEELRSDHPARMVEEQTTDEPSQPDVTGTESVDPETGEIIPTDTAPKQPEQSDLMGDLPEYTFAQINDMLVKSRTMQELDEAADCIRYVKNDHHQEELRKVYHSLRHPDD